MIFVIHVLFLTILWGPSSG